jgi:molybdopterin/thiamine biosynthesis adenylyltransferase
LTDTFDEGSVFARHDKVQGAVLIIGVGTVGSSLAMQLARLGVSLRLIDKDTLEPHNIVRHQLDNTHRWQPKTVLADEIRRRFPWVHAEGIFADFTELPPEERRRYINEADVVVAATDEGDVQRFINRDCIEARKPVVFPGVWVDPDTEEAEAGEVLWVDPRRRMPCYQCVTIYREEAQDAQAGRGAQADIDSIVLATALVVRGALQPGSVHAEILHEHENLMLVHGFIPPSRQAGEIFAGRSILHVQVPFPSRPCPACHRHEERSHEERSAEPERAWQSAEPEPTWEGARHPVLRLIANLITDTLIVAAWPLILLFPMAFVGAFGNPPQLFLGPIHSTFALCGERGQFPVLGSA